MFEDNMYNGNGLSLKNYPGSRVGVPWEGIEYRQMYRRAGAQRETHTMVAGMDRVIG